MLGIFWERKVSGLIDFKPSDHGVLTRMAFSIGRTVARIEFSSHFLELILSCMNTDVFVISRVHDLLPHFSINITYTVRTLEGVTVIHCDEGRA